MNYLHSEQRKHFIEFELISTNGRRVQQNIGQLKEKNKGGKINFVSGGGLNFYLANFKHPQGKKLAYFSQLPPKVVFIKEVIHSIFNNL